jgi:predicted nuclease with TOPRIM domain
MWVWSLYSTHDVCKEVADKKKKCEELTIGLQAKIQAVQEMQKILNEVLAKVNALQAKLEKVIAEKNAL